MRDPEYNTLLPYARDAMRCPSCGAAGLVPRTLHDRLECSACGAHFPGLTTVPDLAPHRATRDGALRGATGWGPTARWARRSARPALDRWVRASGDDLRSDWLTRWLRPAKGPVLALCCGTDRTASEVARWVGVARVIGIDHNLTLLRDTQGSPLDPGLAYLRSVDGRLPFQDETVGAVLAMGGLHQADAPLELVAETGRALRPGGVFVGAVHLDQGPTSLQWLARAAGETPLSREGFAGALDGAGLELLALQLQGITGLFAARRR